MAVQAQYPSNVLLLNRNDQERKNLPKDYTSQTQKPPADFFDQQSFFPTGGNNSVNGRKRGRDSNPTPTSAAAQQQHAPVNLFSVQPQRQQQHQISSAMPSPIHLSHLQPQRLPKQPQQLQQRQPNSLVSTGLRLSFPDNQQNKHQQLGGNLDLSAQIDLQKSDIDQLLHAQVSKPAFRPLLRRRFLDEYHRIIGTESGLPSFTQMEQLRRTLGGVRRTHYRALLSAAEESAARRMQGKAAELEMATRRNVELEESLAKLKAELATLQAKARADEAIAAALQSQLQHAAAGRAAAAVEDPAVSDCESACVDPRWERERERVCRRCLSAEASVVLLPCRHLCVCRGCDAAGRGICPVCSSVNRASVHVYLS